MRRVLIFALLLATQLGIGQQFAPTVTLTWTPSTSPDAGTVSVRRASGGLPFQVIATNIPPAAGYVDATVLPGTVYDYEVFFVDSVTGLASVPSNAVSIVIPNPPRPNPPSGLRGQVGP